MKKVFTVLARIFMALVWVLVFLLMLVWEIFKGLLGLADSMERRKRNGRHRGVMCSPGSRRRRY